jgi:multicomponent Na+:H+ antiporter subunit E
VTIAGRIALLVFVWLLAWGEISVANLLSGAAVAAALLVAFPPERRTGHRARPRVRGLARLAGWVAVQLVVSNVQMTREVLRRRSLAHPGVVVHHLTQPSDYVVTLMTSVICLSPGTMTVDVDADSSTIAVHFYDLRDVTEARSMLQRLERLAVAAIGPHRRAPDLNPAEEEL